MSDKRRKWAGRLRSRPTRLSAYGCQAGSLILLMHGRRRVACHGPKLFAALLIAALRPKPSPPPLSSPPVRQSRRPAPRRPRARKRARGVPRPATLQGRPPFRLPVSVAIAMRLLKLPPRHDEIVAVLHFPHRLRNPAHGSERHCRLAHFQNFPAVDEPKGAPPINDPW